MSGRQLLIVILIAVVIIGVSAGLIADGLRRKDFRDQISGKKPERKADAKTKISYDKKPVENSQISVDREVLKTKSYQNLMGPQ